MSLVGSVDPAFMLVGTFMMNPSTLLFLQKLKGSTGGSYLIESKTDAQGYPLLFGRRVYCSPSYPVIGALAKVASFGDHTKFVSREVRNSLAVRAYTERYAEFGQVGYEAHWQIQGDLAKSSAGPLPVRLLQCHS
jgi:HK97 family phage major capsid protein